MKRPRPAYRNRGSVLLSVLILLTFASVLAFALQRQQSFAMRHTVQFVRSMQAWHYALGGEWYARQVLYEQYNLTPKLVYPAQAWAKPEPAFSLPAGTLSIAVEDMQGRFNLNSLAQKSPLTDHIFQHIMDDAGIAPEKTQRLLAALQLASAGNPAKALQDGALPPAPQKPQLATMPSCNGTPFLAEASQLIDNGLSVEDYRKIAAYVTALPDTCLAFNINSVPELLENILIHDDHQREAIRQYREQQGYLTAENIVKLGLVASISADSHYFTVKTSVSDDSGSYVLASIIKRSLTKDNNVAVTTLARKWQPCLECIP